ncbi:MAG: recombinase family protein [Bdellovibrionales bacterium]|nr:recombinase family protein [Bdellovibrionales bacterium]
MADQKSQLVAHSSKDLRLFSDDSTSKERNGFKKLCEALENSKGGQLFVYDLRSLDKCFNSAEDLLSFLALIEHSRIELVSLTESMPEAFNASYILNTYRVISKELHKEHIQNSLRQRKNVGLTVGRPPTRDDHQIIELRRKGLTYREIAQQLKISIGAVQRGLSDQAT